MNRYLLAGAAALLILLGLSGVGGPGRRAQGNVQMPGAMETEAATLGNLPIEQAGQVVQRQGSGSGTPTPMTNLDSTAGSGATAPTEPSPPQPGASSGAAPLPAPAGDISPVQPDLVRPDPLPPTQDPALDAIPALW